jgi:hypothetical protein
MKINGNELYKLNINLSNCIVSCFSRSFDKHHFENNRMHLISSVVFIENFSFNKIPIKIYSGVEPKYYTFVIKPKFEYENNKYVYVINDNLNLVIVFIDFDYLLDLFQNESLDLINNLFGKKKMEKKDFSLLYNNSLFIFSDICWSNIILNFKIRGVDISGGSISKRHVLSTVDFQLFKGLYFLYSSDEEQVRQLLFNNYKDDFLSSSIPLDLYKKYVSINIKLNKLNIKDYNNNSVNNLILENNNNKLINYISMDGYSTDLNKIILNNYLYSIDLFKKNIINNFNLKISNLEEKLMIIKSNISSNKNFIEEKENLIKYGSAVSSVKQKKLLKKERTYFSSNEGLKEIVLKKRDLENLIIKFKALESKILNLKNELEEFNKNYLNLNIEELSKLNELKSKMI